MANFCETCGWWDTTCCGSIIYGHAGGVCKCEKLCEDSEGYASDKLVYCYDEGGGFWTGPEFGCVHHKTKDRIEKAEGLLNELKGNGFNIKLVTTAPIPGNGMTVVGSQYIQPENIDIEDDGSITFVVNAWIS